MQEVTPHTRMDELVESLQSHIVGEDNAGDGKFVGCAVRTNDAVTEKCTDLLQEGFLLIVGACNLVSNKTGNAEFAEFIEYGGFATPYTTGEGYIQAPLCLIGAIICF